MEVFDKIATALARWSAREGVDWLVVDEVLEKQGSDHRYLSIAFVAPRWRPPPTQEEHATAKRFAADLMREHPELGGTHLVFWNEAPEFGSEDEAEQAAAVACAFAREHLDRVTQTCGTHNLYVGEASVDAHDGVIVWIVRDDCDPRYLALDEDDVAAEIQAAYGGRVTFQGTYCK
ncbi:hypothetical protein [Nannocystis pusilla]|uniref:hypothetical protein n=1 Tax=Nannocystis pusilla TaxID=889268 RepID=UPI003B7C35B6